MYRLLLILSLLLLGAEAADHFNTLESALENAAEHQKTVMMLYSTDSCPECAYMKQKVFPQSDVKAYLDAHFVIVEKDVIKDDPPAGYEHFGIPTFFFVDASGKKLETFVGGARHNEFLELLQSVRGIR